MGTLVHQAEKQRIVLDSECIVGRSTRCSVRIENPMVSAVHACVRWTPKGWLVRDLGSRNGTFLNGTRVTSTDGSLVRCGDQLAFGTREVVWELEDEASPEAMVIGSNGTVNLLTDGMIVIPSSEQPIATVYLDSEGNWLVDSAELGAKPIRNNESFWVGDQEWRFSCPESALQTVRAKSPDIRDSLLMFAVSRDEEHVTLTVESTEKPVALGSRAHNYLLLTLARRRLGDAESGIAASSCGWIHQDDLARALRTEPEHINVEIFRIRRRLASYFLNSAQIVERRVGTGQLRLGVGKVEIERL
jgi:hypothetical protein